MNGLYLDDWGMILWKIMSTGTVYTFKRIFYHQFLNLRRKILFFIAFFRVLFSCEGLLYHCFQPLWKLRAIPCIPLLNYRWQNFWWFVFWYCLFFSFCFFNLISFLAVARGKQWLRLRQPVWLLYVFGRILLWDVCRVLFFKEGNWGEVMRDRSSIERSWLFFP